MSSDSDSSGPVDKKPPPKKSKEEKGKKKSEPEKKSKKRPAESDEGSDDEDKNRWEIGPKRFISVSEFKGKMRVDIREFYNTPDGEERPGKKGISLSEDQWKKLKSFIPAIDKKVKEG